MSNVLALEGICRYYTSGENALTVLSGASFTISTGELVALIGPSGSGKTTLLQIAGLLDRPNAGVIRIQGEEATQADDTARTKLRNQHLGFVYQFHNLLPEMTALENVMLPQRIGGKSRSASASRAEALLSRLGLQQRLHHLPAQLSGGEQQRVAVARAFANHPSLILADEPTGNLDPATSEIVLNLFLDVAQEEGTAALIATHNLALAKRLKRAVTLRDGLLVEATL